MFTWTLLPDLLVLTGLVTLSALSLVFSRRHLAPDEDRVVEELNSLLPQTQCAQCGYPGCRPYAEALADGAPVNLCPPGGQETAQQLAAKLGRSSEPLILEEPAPVLARIVESECIGCTLCISACPVDAIVGAAQKLHTVLSDVCTGCELCLPPCPVDCIELDALPRIEGPEFPTETMACINCGFCVTACPRTLQPHLLYLSSQAPEIPDELRLEDCIECRRCDQVCPSQIPLTSAFQAAKHKQAGRHQVKKAAAFNEARYQARQSRLDDQRDTLVSKPSQKDRESLLNLIREDP